MEINERWVGDVTILDLKGKMTLGEGDEMLKERIVALVAKRRVKIILNHQDQFYIDSAGLGELLRSYTSLSRQGGQLKLLNLTQRVLDLLAITRMLHAFDIFMDEDEAVRSFAK